MPEYLSPGVYVEEIPSVSRPIAGVGTSTPGFIGVLPDTIRLPARPLDGDSTSAKTQGYKYVNFTIPALVNKAYRITSWGQYVKLFGDFVGGNTLLRKSIIVEGTGATAKTYVTGVVDPCLTVTASWGSKKLSGVADVNGVYKIEIDAGTTVVSITTEYSGTDSKVNDGQRYLAHAVFGFFNNGGSSCYVVRATGASELDGALSALAAVDEVAMIAAPGLANVTAYSKLISHCELLKDRVAILDSVESDADFGNGTFTKLESVAAGTTVGRPQNSTYAAFYFPWLQVSDPATSLIANGKGDGLVYVPPSGHVAGVYARSDATRGVFKAPANEALMGVTGLRYSLSKPDQDSLNDDGVNLIRPLIGAMRIWGARTVGGDANGEYKYISTRRYFNYLRESIDQGTQFVVFEPNTIALWERIKRSVGEFLLNEWRAGALLGAKPEQAFYVKCDADTNPAEVRDAGMVVTEIGVAIVKPAEFVIFRIQQTSGN